MLMSLVANGLVLMSLVANGVVLMSLVANGLVLMYLVANTFKCPDRYLVWAQVCCKHELLGVGPRPERLIALEI